MADGMALPRVIKNELLHCGQTSLQKEVLGADTTGPAVVSRYYLIELEKFCLLPQT